MKVERMKKTWMLLFVFALMAVPAVAARKPPPINAILLAQAQAMPQDQTFHMTSRSSFVMNAGAHSAQLNGAGSARLDGGVTVVPANSQLAVTFRNTDDPAFADCQEGLGGDLRLRGTIDVSGKGYFTVNITNGSLSQVTIMIDSVTSCIVSQ